jgi:hypothetical protein
MTIALESEIVGSAYDARTHMHSYTIDRGGRRWTVKIPAAELDRNGPLLGAKAGVARMRRRGYLAARLTNAMQGPHDGA